MTVDFGGLFVLALIWAFFKLVSKSRDGSAAPTRPQPRPGLGPMHDPPQDHVIVIRSGRMRWTVEDQTLDPEPGDVIVTPAGTAHSYEVLGDEPARVVRVDSPVRRQTES